jgi:hypothetical protein
MLEETFGAMLLVLTTQELAVNAFFEFFSTYRNQYPGSRDVLREIADQVHNWVKHHSQK